MIQTAAKNNSNEGVVATLDELIALKRYVQKSFDSQPSRSFRLDTHDSKRRGRGMDFAEVRNYQAGDEIRHMEWRVTARTGRPHIKLYQEERERAVAIVCDMNPSMYFGTRQAFKSVIAARLSALLAWSAIKQEDKVGGVIYSLTKQDEFSPRQRQQGVLPFLAALSHYTEVMPDGFDSPRPLSEALVRLRRVNRPGSVIVIVSDFYSLDGNSELQLKRLRAHNDMLLYHVCDPIELTPPKANQYPITNGRDDMMMDTSRKEMLKQYRYYSERHLNTVSELCKRLRVPYLQATAEIDISQLVRRTFPKRGRHG